MLCLLEKDSLHRVESHSILAVDTDLKEPPNRISYGIEDARALVANGQLTLVGASVGYGRDRVKSQAIAARIDISKKRVHSLKVLDTPDPAKQQKNWIPLVHNNELVVIRWWNPVKITLLEEDLSARLDHTVESKGVSNNPPLLGSSNLVELSESQAEQLGTS